MLVTVHTLIDTDASLVQDDVTVARDPPAVDQPTRKKILYMTVLYYKVIIAFPPPYFVKVLRGTIKIISCQTRAEQFMPSLLLSYVNKAVARAACRCATVPNHLTTYQLSYMNLVSEQLPQRVGAVSLTATARTHHSSVKVVYFLGLSHS